jgi:TM2 domain-containing membrane protein YozV
MRLLVYLIAGSLSGFGAHRAYNPSLAMGSRSGTLLRYGIGGMLILPFLLLFVDLIPAKKEDDAVMRAGIGYLIALGCVGVGVAAAHIIDQFNGGD